MATTRMHRRSKYLEAIQPTVLLPCCRIRIPCWLFIYNHNTLSHPPPDGHDWLYKEAPPCESLSNASCFGRLKFIESPHLSFFTPKLTQDVFALETGCCYLCLSLHRYLPLPQPHFRALTKFIAVAHATCARNYTVHLGDTCDLISAAQNVST